MVPRGATIHRTAHWQPELARTGGGVGAIGFLSAAPIVNFASNPRALIAFAIRRDKTLPIFESIFEMVPNVIQPRKPVVAVGR